MSSLIVGLGNPEPRYELTRHNLGFIMLDLLSDYYGFRQTGEKKNLFSAYEGTRRGFKLFGLKPLTYMNRSGLAVVPHAQFYKVPIERTIVLHDDIDLPFGEVRYKEGGGHGGHNGLRSIGEQWGSKEFKRIRLGIGRGPGPISPHDWVLGVFEDAELRVVESTMLDKTIALMDVFLDTLVGH